MFKSPADIVEAALRRNDFVNLLLGSADYCYKSRWSPAPGDTDLTELLDEIYDGLAPPRREVAAKMLASALVDMQGTYEGMEPTATCILLESMRKKEGRESFNLPLLDMANQLQKTIDLYKEKLTADKRGGGQYHSDGLYGDLRRISANIVNLGGPSIMK